MRLASIANTPINTTHHVLSAHAHNLAQFVGKGRQHADAAAPARAL